MKKAAVVVLGVWSSFGVGFGQFEFSSKEKMSFIKMNLLNSIERKINILDEILKIKPSVSGLITDRFRAKELDQWARENETAIVSVFGKFGEQETLLKENLAAQIKALSFNEHEKEFLEELGAESSQAEAWKPERMGETRTRLEAARQTLSEELKGIEKEQKKPELLNSGFLDLFSSGTSKGTARLFKIRIGEPSLYGYKRFSVPLYIYVGAKGNSISKEKPDPKKESYYDLIDPLGGILNLHFYDVVNVAASKFRMTYLGLAYQLGLKLMNGEEYEVEEYGPTNSVVLNANRLYANGFGSAGLSFQTAAWEPEKSGRSDGLGIFWIQARVTGNIISRKKLGQIFGDNTMSGLFLGFAGELGIFIDNKVNFKIGAFKNFNSYTNPSLAFIKDWVVKFSLDYSLSK
jgi:hypothetical protein